MENFYTSATFNLIHTEDKNKIAQEIDGIGKIYIYDMTKLDPENYITIDILTTEEFYVYIKNNLDEIDKLNSTNYLRLILFARINKENLPFHNGIIYNLHSSNYSSSLKIINEMLDEQFKEFDQKIILEEFKSKINQQ